MKLDATYTPVACDERMLRIILTGKDMRTGDELKGGPLASRVPKALVLLSGASRWARAPSPEVRAAPRAGHPVAHGGRGHRLRVRAHRQPKSDPFAKYLMARSIGAVALDLGVPSLTAAKGLP